MELAVATKGSTAPGSDVCPPDEPTTYPVPWYFHGVEDAYVGGETARDCRSDDVGPKRGQRAAIQSASWTASVQVGCWRPTSIASQNSHYCVDIIPCAAITEPHLSAVLGTSLHANLACATTHNHDMLPRADLVTDVFSPSQPKLGAIRTSSDSSGSRT